MIYFIFDTFPEGIVDQNDYQIFSSVQAALDIEVVDGNLIDGTVWWDGSCDLGTPYTGLLIEGRIRIGGRTADVKVWDIISGKKVTFLEGVLRRDDFIVEFSDFPNWSKLNNSRIARNPVPALNDFWQNTHCDSFQKNIQD